MDTRAGLAGLVATHELTRRGKKMTLVEREERRQTLADRNFGCSVDPTTATGRRRTSAESAGVITRAWRRCEAPATAAQR